MEFEIARHFIGKQTLNAEGTRKKVRDCAKFEIAHVQDSKSLLCLFRILKIILYVRWFQFEIPMDTSSLIFHRFDIDIPHGKFVEISSILKGESTWKLWHWFDVETSTWIRLSKSTKYRWVLHVDFSMSFRCRFNVTSVLAVSILSFPNIFCCGNLF